MPEENQINYQLPRRWMRSFIALLLLFSFIAGTERGQASNLEALTHVEDALKSALKSYQGHEAQRQLLRGSFEAVPTARADYLPRLDFGVKLEPWSIDAVDGKFRDGRKTISETITLSQSVFSWLTTYHDVKDAEQRVELAFSVYEDQLQALLTDVAKAYTQVLTEKIRLRLRKGNLSQAQASVEAARERFAIGDYSQSDLALAEAELARADVGVIDGRRLLEESERLFSSYTNKIVADDSRFPDFSAFLDEELRRATTEADFVAKILSQNLQLKTKRIQLGIAEMRYRQSQTTPMPIDVSVVGRAKWQQELGATPNRFASIPITEQSYSIGIQANFQLYRGGRAGSTRRGLYHQRDQLRAEYRTLEGQISHSAQALYRRKLDQNALLASVERSLEAQRIVNEGYEAGENLGIYSRLDVLEARRRLFEAQLNLVTTRSAAVQTDVSLLGMLGLFNPVSLDFAEYDDIPSLKEEFAKVKWRMDPFE